jgi:hypothetical protein
MRADEKGSGKGTKTGRPSHLSGLPQPKPKAVPAALVFVADYPAEILYHIIPAGHLKG